jgi:hypothetical protein
MAACAPVLKPLFSELLLLLELELAIAIRLAAAVTAVAPILILVLILDTKLVLTPAAVLTALGTL